MLSASRFEDREASERHERRGLVAMEGAETLRKLLLARSEA